MKIDFSAYTITVVIPAHRVENQILFVLDSLPEYIRWIIVVNDCSPDATAKIVRARCEADPRIILVSHEQNQGVGGAMRTGYQKALELESDIVIKFDGDGQMSADDIPALITPLIRGKADVTKGNRFRDFVALRKMPFVRRIGNMGLSFLSKAATGYWNCFDPTNGFLAIRGEILQKIPLKQLHKSYFFEISQLGQFYLIGALIHDVPLPARYADEKSNLSISKVLREFPMLLLNLFIRRIILRHFIFDFSMFGIYLLTSLPLMSFGLIFGINRWIFYASREIPAPTGTVMLPTLALITGLQILLEAIRIDQQSVPKEPVCEPLR